MIIIARRRKKRNRKKRRKQGEKTDRSTTNSINNTSKEKFPSFYWDGEILYYELGYKKYKPIAKLRGRNVVRIHIKNNKICQVIYKHLFYLQYSRNEIDAIFVRYHDNIPQEIILITTDKGYNDILKWLSSVSKKTIEVKV